MNLLNIDDLRNYIQDVVDSWEIGVVVAVEGERHKPAIVLLFTLPGGRRFGREVSLDDLKHEPNIVGYLLDSVKREVDAALGLQDVPVATSVSPRSINPGVFVTEATSPRPRRDFRSSIQMKLDGSPKFLSSPPEAKKPVPRVPVRADDLGDPEERRKHALAAEAHMMRTRAQFSPEEEARQEENQRAVQERLRLEREAARRKAEAEQRIADEKRRRDEEERRRQERLEEIKESALASWEGLDRLLEEAHLRWAEAALAESNAYDSHVEDELFGSSKSSVAVDAAWEMARQATSRLEAFVRRRLAEVEARASGLGISEALEDVELYEEEQDAQDLHTTEEEFLEEQVDEEGFSEMERQRRLASFTAADDVDVVDDTTMDAQAGNKF